MEQTNTSGSAFKRWLERTFTVKNIAVTSVLTAISFVLYAFVKFKLPFIFPAFLDVQFSDMPALLAGFSMGPIAGCVVIIVKCGMKMIFGMSQTACVGELADIFIGIAFVLPASLVYRKLKTKKGAVLSLVVGSVIAIVVSIFANRWVLVPFYAKAYGMDAIIGMVASLYDGVTAETFYNYYLPLGVAPFNALRCVVCAVITFLVYKPLSRALHWEFASKKRDETADVPAEQDQTAQTVAKDDDLR